MPHAFPGLSSPSPVQDGVFAQLRRLRRSALSVLALFATIFGANVAHGQYRTSVQGVVTDPSGAVIPGASLTLKNNSTNETVVRTSSGDGVFNFNALPADTFTLTVDHAGFQKKVLSHLEVIPEQANSLSVELALAGTTQTVTVDASTTPAVDTETANTGRHTIQFGADYTNLHYLSDPTGRPNYGFYNIWDFLNDARSSESGGFNTGLNIRVGGNLWTPQKGNLGPQLGFNWSPDAFHGKLTVRGGYGLNSNQEEIAISAATGNNPPVQGNYNFQYNSPSDPGSNGGDIIYGISSSPTSLNGFA